MSDTDYIACHIDNLPQEVLDDIFSSLDCRSLFFAGQVNTRWRDTATNSLRKFVLKQKDNDTAWKEVISEDDIETLKKYEFTEIKEFMR